MILYFLFLLINTVNSLNISVIGCGYSGLTSSIYLSQLGYNVSIYEKNSFCGGRSFSKKINNNEFSWVCWYIMPNIYDDIFNTLNQSRNDYYNIYEPQYGYNLFYENKLYNIKNNIFDFKNQINILENNSKITKYFETATIFENLGVSLMYDYENL